MLREHEKMHVYSTQLYSTQLKESVLLDLRNEKQKPAWWSELVTKEV